MKNPILSFALPKTTSDGFVVVAVLWILGTLSALVSIYAAYVINTAAGFSVHDQHLRAEGLVSAAVELTAYRKLSAPALPGPTRNQFSFRLNQATVEVEYESEAARIDVNEASKLLLVGLFVALGARQQDAEIYGDRIIAWRTPPTNGQDSEAIAYRAAGLAYGPRGAKFPHINELSLVRDLPIAIVERALPFVTVYSARPEINIFDAAPQVLAALPGMTPDRLHMVLVRRQSGSENGNTLLPLLGAAQQFATTDSSKALRIFVRIKFDGGRQSNSEVVIAVLEQGDKPFVVLSWHNDLDDNSANILRKVGSR